MGKTTVTETPLNSRAQDILREIVSAYSTTGQPVGSKALVELGDINLSAASVRNVMQDLEKRGLLTHPHTSAGRIPTTEGFRYYAKQLITSDDFEQSLDPALKKEIQAKVKPGKNLQTVLKDVSDTLSTLTGCAGLITAPKLTADPLEQVEFIRLSGDRVLVVMVTTHGAIENRIINVPAFVDTNELNKAATHLKKIVGGQTLDAARNQMIQAIAEQRGRVNEMIDQMMQAAHEWGEPVVSDGAMVVAGSTNLFQYPELVREKLQNLVKIFEEKRLLMALMDEVRHGEGVQIFVGNDSAYSKLENLKDDCNSLEDCSVIASPYKGADGNLVGTLGVIGPVRLNYKQAVGVVNYTSRLLSNVLGDSK